MTRDTYNRCWQRNLWEGYKYTNKRAIVCWFIYDYLL